MVPVRGAAVRRWLEPVARARRRFAPGAGNLAVGVRFLCAAAHLGAGQLCCGSVTRWRAQGCAPAGAARGLGARGRQAAYGSPSDRLWRPGRHGGGWPSWSRTAFAIWSWATVGQ